MQFVPIQQNRGLGAFEIPGLKESMEQYFKDNPINIDYNKWINNLTPEEKAQIDERAKEIEKEMIAGTYTSSTYNPVKQPVTTTTQQPKTTNTTTNTTTTVKQSNTSNTVATPKTAEEKKWIPGLDNWVTGSLVGVAAITIVTTVIIVTKKDKPKKKKKK
ncbi:hypothetical protein V9L05_08685 [Bernardetia sp. Wsw4-3y2]|uniref:hypothetical protein n=1 Tax=Bernardetia sp. Wsw4-3y2 TaxID=3127471 RepID=UPI0030D57C64